MIQREILDLIKELGRRSERGEKREFTSDEIGRLGELRQRRDELPSTAPGSRYAFYETRVATILRVNGKYRDAMKHLLRALSTAPTHLFTDRKLVSTLIKCGFGLRPDRSLLVEDEQEDS